MGWKATRRELVTGAFAAVAAVTAAGGTPDAVAAPLDAEPKALSDALKIERLVVIAYRQVLGTDLLKPKVNSLLRVMLDQELQHVVVVERALSQQQQPVPPAPADIAAAQDALGRHNVHRSLTHFRSQHDCLRLLVDVESLAEGAYFTAIEKVNDAALLRACTEIMGCEAQHWSLLSGIQHHGDVTKSVPYPFVAGST